jgi:hypothetical protein
MSKTILCPECGQSKTVEKVSTLYLTGIGLSGEAKNSPARPPKLIQANSKPGSYALSRKLAPPAASRPAFTRPVQPDQAVLAFSLIVPIFLYGILTSQRALFLPALGALFIFYGLYFWQRKRLLARFEQEQAARQAADERIKKGIERWMRLYYCAEDEIVFEPDQDAGVMVDLMPGYLLQEESSKTMKKLCLALASSLFVRSMPGNDLEHATLCSANDALIHQTTRAVRALFYHLPA